jgi:hypothetical protein
MRTIADQNSSRGRRTIEFPVEPRLSFDRPLQAEKGTASVAVRRCVADCRRHTCTHGSAVRPLLVRQPRTGRRNRLGVVQQLADRQGPISHALCRSTPSWGVCTCMQHISVVLILSFELIYHHTVPQFRSRNHFRYSVSINLHATTLRPFTKQQLHTLVQRTIETVDQDCELSLCDHSSTLFHTY